MRIYSVILSRNEIYNDNIVYVRRKIRRQRLFVVVVYFATSYTDAVLWNRTQKKSLYHKRHSVSEIRVHPVNCNVHVCTRKTS